MKISFSKMSGAGNDFVVIDNRLGIILDPHSFSQTVCKRRLGIGADGVLLLEQSDKADFKMQYYNADGSSSGMCGNGGRCIAKFAYDNKIVTKEKFTFEAFNYIYHASYLNSECYELKMKDPFDLKRDQIIKLNGKTLSGNYLNTGTEHSIIFVEENPKIGTLDTADIFTLGRQVRYNEIYQPNGTNVNFVSKMDDNSIKIRTYERGVEEETLACGTGSIASALLSSLKFGMVSPVIVKAQSGSILQIGFQKDTNGTFKNVTLRGPAERIFEGVIDIY